MIGNNQMQLVERAMGILLTPKTEWEKIDAESGTIGDIYRNYVLLLAAIPAVAGFIGAILFGYSFLGVTFRPSIGSALTTAVLQYAMALASVFILALIIEALAPTFQATADRVQAFKVAAYSATATWVAGILTLLPTLAPIALLLGLYSFYLLYLGLPRLMKAPAEKAIGYTVVVVIAAVVVMLVIGGIVSSVSSGFGPGL